MDPLLRGTDAFLEELRLLDLLSPEEAERFAVSSTVCESTATCAERLIAAGVLTAYQSEQVLAGKGRRLRIGPYVLRQPLGDGGMGRVFKAEHRLMKRVVALKLMGRVRRDRHDEAMLSRFHREVEAAGRLRHPRIVTAYDAGVSRGWLYLAMEYLDGIDLQRFVADTGPLPLDLACEIVRQTAEALHHAHQRGLVHRDIKPSNLLLTTPGVAVKLLDLGLAQSIDLTASDGELCGTPDFMAPEWGHTADGPDVRGDLYSLGCTFYFLLSGCVPHPGGSWTEKLLRHRLDEPTPIRQLRPDVPASIAAIVERLMAREVEQRYLAADAVVDDLMALSSAPLAMQKEAQTAPEKKQSLRSPSRRKRFLLAALLAMLLGVATAGGARRMVAPSAESTTPAVAASAPLFSIVGRPEGFSSLAKAIAAANDGDSIILSGPGPFVTSPLCWQGKALTLRAANGTRPRLELRSNDDPWQALLQTDRALTLEGLELALAEDKSRKRTQQATPLIRCAGAPLSLSNCRLFGGADGAVLVARNPGAVIVRNCRIDAGAVGVSVEVGQGGSVRLHIEKTKLTVRDPSGAALSLWAAELRQATPVALELHDNTLDCGCLAVLRDLPAPLTITARDNHFLYRTALLRYTRFAASAPWRDTVWQGGGNTYQGPAQWLWVEEKPVALPSLAELRP